MNFMTRSAPEFAFRSLTTDALLALLRMLPDRWRSGRPVVCIDRQDSAQWLPGPVIRQRLPGLCHSRRSEEVALLADLIAQIRRELCRIHDVLFPRAVAAL